MKTIKGMNEKVSVLFVDNPSDPIPTFKEVLLNVIALNRKKPGDGINPAERLGTTKIGMAILASRDELQIEDEHFDVLKKILNSSFAYSEFIMGQWTLKLNEIEMNDMAGKKGK